MNDNLGLFKPTILKVILTFSIIIGFFIIERMFYGSGPMFYQSSSFKTYEIIFAPLKFFSGLLGYYSLSCLLIYVLTYIKKSGKKNPL